MKMTEVGFESGQPPIDGYAPGGFRLGGRFIEGGLLVAPSGVCPWPSAGGAIFAEAPPDGLVWRLSAPAAEDLAALGNAVDVVLVGAGGRLRRLSGLDALEAAGIGVECMDSAAACRSYNVLLSEGRRVAAAFAPIDL